MGRIQSSVGLVSGLAIEDTVNQLMALNAQPRDRLSARNDLLGREQVALTELTTLVIGVQLTSDRLGQASLFSSTKVSSSKTDVLTVRSTGAPKPGSYSFIPVQQAQSQQLTSSLYSSADQKLTSGEVVIHTGGFLDESVQLDRLNGGAGVARGSINITDRSGTTQKIDLRFAQTAADVVNAINANDSLSVVASLDGDRLVLNDVSGSTSSNLKVTEVGGGRTAADLGLAGLSVAADTATGESIYSLDSKAGLRTLRDGRGLDLPDSGTALKFNLQDGSSIDFETSLDVQSASLGQLINEINTAGDGKLRVSIAADGNSLKVEDLTSGSESFSVTSPDGSLASQLGFASDAVGGVITGDKLQAGLNDTLLSSLNGGKGLGELGTITITDRNGASDTIDLSSAESLNDIIDALNDGADNASFKVQLNRSKTGIEIVDTSGGSGTLEIEDADATATATSLKIASSSTDGSIDSGSLHRQFVGRNTTIAEFTRGAGLSSGSIKFTDSAGKTANLNLRTLKPDTIGDVIDGINNLGIGIKAKINETGDGLLLVDSKGGEDPVTVTNVGTGTAATELGIAGTASQIEVNGETVTGIDGSRTIRLQTTAETSISDLAEQINALGFSPVTANVLSLGNNGVRLQLNSDTTGSRARVAIDSSSGIDFSQTTEARDAVLAFGANESGGGVLVTSSTNNFTGLVEDLDFTVVGTSTSPVTVEVTENVDNLTKQVQSFVDQYNKLRDKYNDLTVFDSTTNQVGLLFGSNSALRLEIGFTKLLSQPFRTGSGNTIRSLPEIGVRLNDQGKLAFDKDKFDAALAANPDAVKDFFTNEENGFSKQARKVSDSLAGIKQGALLNRSNAIQNQIEQNGKRISSMDVRLDRQRTRLLNQFYAMEQAISKLQQNQTAIGQIQPLSLYTG